MGPPREHGGMNTHQCALCAHEIGLQWGRRVNTAECSSRASRVTLRGPSMGPPREHGGMSADEDDACARHLFLQWGRRVNTAECVDDPITTIAIFSLQWGRRVNTAECAIARWRINTE